jgi:hypothetical protein
MQGNVGVSFVNAVKHAQLTVVLLLITSKCVRATHVSPY